MYKNRENICRKTRVTACLCGKPAPPVKRYLFRFDGIGRTCFGTGTAIGTFFRINNVNRITFADCVDRTLRYTGTTGKTCVINLMGHVKPPLELKLWVKFDVTMPVPDANVGADMQGTGQIDH